MKGFLLGTLVLSALWVALHNAKNVGSALGGVGTLLTNLSDPTRAGIRQAT